MCIIVHPYFFTMTNISALILTVRKHTGNNIIVDCYTREKGRMAFIYSFTKSNKGHRALLSPMNWVSFTISDSVKMPLPRPKELQALHLYRSIGNHPIKNLVMLFLSEIISHTIREEHRDEDMFHFFENALDYYDEQEQEYNNFHLSFLVGLTALLGIAPPVDSDQTTDNLYAMWEGKMSVLEKDNFKKICLTPINQCHLIKLNASERSKQLNIILDYLQHYAPGFKVPKSLALFREF